MKVRIVALVLLALLLGVNVGAQSAQPVVIASHSILADVARNIAGDHLEVRTLIPAGSDPHHFVPTPSDLAAVADADLVLINGVGYEETLLEAIENAGVDVNIVVASACIDIRPASAHDEDHDDHEHEDDMHDDHDDHAHDDDDEHAHDEDHDDHGHDEDHDDHGHEEDQDEHGHEEDQD
ncbi:MAG: metal ABC transporter substrate-binding protein, partial [Chloroflexi bacterium]|nr:metal ABC transporter substrate-binding protein [Chloroflexota bacterium]